MTSRKMELVHPGEILRMEIIEGRHLTIGKAAELLDVTRANLSNILNGKVSITPNMALRVEAVFGGSARIWTRLQAAYDLSLAQQNFNAHPPKIKHIEVV